MTQVREAEPTDQPCEFQITQRNLYAFEDRAKRVYADYMCALNFDVKLGTSIGKTLTYETAEKIYGVSMSYRDIKSALSHKRPLEIRPPISPDKGEYEVLDTSKHPNDPGRTLLYVTTQDGIEILLADLLAYDEEGKFQSDMQRTSKIAEAIRSRRKIVLKPDLPPPYQE